MADYAGNDIYCDVIIPGLTEVKIIAETSRVLAFHHTRPHWPVHIVIIPKVHLADLLDLTNHDDLAIEVLTVVQEVAAMVMDQEGACRVMTNVGNYQTSKHLHFLVISGDAADNAIV